MIIRIVNFFLLPLNHNLNKKNKMKNLDKLPSVMDYRLLLDIVIEKFNISIETARKKYGLFTVKQWNELLEK